ncbi:hypothetical protein M3P05_06995 [Sansalvadorimonas sp. 2012CJ34-2]|uniref:Uncharacterized protein n=1 Tax=Parendozoicomonas callyspongiae TaxID=2942213 RepID=A0ABT0PE89_9GAMM|nr:hypothetical protein [Sansalvadorimonas sp. 2012CJ34-2]MCL6269684.1 hypothetical protein [Sansalvadorimonas sp. 2012CJ34-2]
MSKLSTFMRFIGLPGGIAAAVYGSIDNPGFRCGVEKIPEFAGRTVKALEYGATSVQNFNADMVGRAASFMASTGSSLASSIAERSVSLYNSASATLIGHSGTCPLPYSQVATAAKCAADAAPGLLVRAYETASAMFWGSLPSSGSTAATTGHVIECTNELCVVNPSAAWTTLTEYLGSAAGYINSGFQYVYSSLPDFSPAATYVGDGLNSLCSNGFGTTYITDALSKVVSIDINWGAASFQFGRLLNAISLGSPVLTPLVEFGVASAVRSFYSSRQEFENKALKDRLIEETDPTIKKEEATKQQKKLEESSRYYKKLADRSIVSFSGALKCALTVAPAAFLVPQVGVPVAAAIAVGGLVTRFGTHFLEASRNRSMERKMQTEADSFKRMASNADDTEKLIAENERLKNIDSIATKRDEQLSDQVQANQNLQTQNTALEAELKRVNEREAYALAWLQNKHKKQIDAITHQLQDAEKKANQEKEELMDMTVQLELQKQNLQEEIDTYYREKATDKRKGRNKEQTKRRRKQTPRRERIEKSCSNPKPYQSDSSGFNTPELTLVPDALDKLVLTEKLQQVANTQSIKVKGMENDEEAVIPVAPEVEGNEQPIVPEVKATMEPLTSKSSYIIDEEDDDDDEGISVPFPFNFLIPSNGREQYDY